MFRVCMMIGQSVRPKSLASPAEARNGLIAERKPKLVIEIHSTTGDSEPAPPQKLLHHTAFDHRDRSYHLCISLGR